ncbi:hypothetical protein GLAREA_08301 [Glarea lozoyensis ATCC 20868]|uniref:Calcineurin-like phosphoesterase domain-containing protein n=1 Tax=Glarea lozoyensis (strain ATCC 20868 / MF5171) TaxID=1116229 RepID=S3CGP6_GLAL2|nr:uncharacterized protein GLAREA_08301 [Glarea lozoyensis ATCC 20868]EPE24449.1 hypothetical protein GLAREA_08301 [Glarea lozoyensis ATCC 20868]
MATNQISSMLGIIRSLFRKNSSTQRPFQILSDLHLEVGQQYSTFKIPVAAPYLILAGDIGRLIDYEQLEREPVLNSKLVLLDKKRFDIPNPRVTILGCTLWSKIATDAREIVRTRVKDFQNIESWNIDDHNAAHESDISWLRNEIKSIEEENQQIEHPSLKRRVLVVTHHAPCLQQTSSPRNAENPWSSAFATDLIREESAGEWKNVKAWVFGHTQFTTEFTKCGIVVSSNQRGYVLPGREEKKAKGSIEDREVFHVKRAISV